MCDINRTDSNQASKFEKFVLDLNFLFFGGPLEEAPGSDFFASFLRDGLINFPTPDV